MKIQRKESEFQPVVITLETQDEVDQMYAVMRFVDFRNKPNDITNELFSLLEEYQDGYKYNVEDWDKDTYILSLE